jgi:nucleoside-diphosphate-sugar epimerase
MLHNSRVLMTGVTGQVAGALAGTLAADNEVFGLARFSRPGSRAAVTDLGVTPIACDYTTGTLDGVPDDVDYVLHAGADLAPVDLETGLRQNADATGLLFNHFRSAKAWLYVSTAAVYWDHPDPWYAYRETDRCGGSARVTARTAYGISKFAGEAVARTLSRIHGVPLTVARLNWPYGPSGRGGLLGLVTSWVAAGQPVPHSPDWDLVGSPIHQDDLADQIGPLFAAATVGGTVVNWSGDETIVVEDVAAWVADRLGTTCSFTEWDEVIANPCNLDPTKRRSITGPCRVSWQDGLSRLIEQRRAAGTL